MRLRQKWLGRISLIRLNDKFCDFLIPLNDKFEE